MNFEKLWEILRIELPRRIKSKKGLSIFAIKRAKFEGWLKVEVIDILCNYSSNVIPEKDRIDIVFDNFAIELKTMNTSYKFEGVENKTKPLSKNIQALLKDIKKLKQVNYSQKVILFIVFPLDDNNIFWRKHLYKIKDNVSVLKEENIEFKNGVCAKLYLGLVGE